jgi:hypothetical protein
VKRLFSAWTALVVLATIVLLAAMSILPGRRHVALDAYVLFLGAVGLAVAVRATTAASPDVHEPTLEDEVHDPIDALPLRPRELERLEREVYLSLGSSFYLHHRLRPVLREIAAHRLLLHHGVDLDRRPGAAETMLGEPAWSWLRPDREAPNDHWAHGPPLSELRAVVDALERI